MARLPKNSPWQLLQGHLGKAVVFKQYKDKVVVSQYPDMRRVKPSPLQLENRERMKQAVAYALSILQDPEKRAEFEKALKPGESVYHKAKKAYFERLKNKEA